MVPIAEDETIGHHVRETTVLTGNEKIATLETETIDLVTEDGTITDTTTEIVSAKELTMMSVAEADGHAVVAQAQRVTEQFESETHWRPEIGTVRETGKESVSVSVSFSRCIVDDFGSNGGVRGCSACLTCCFLDQEMRFREAHPAV
jgi:hypothetical protein